MSQGLPQTSTPSRIQGLKNTTTQDYLERMLRLQDFLAQNLDEDLGPENLASVAHMSPFHFHRVFRGMFGESVSEHVRRLRLERSAQRLRHTSWTILRIAVEAGYHSHEAFTRAFKSNFNITPSRFRKQPSTRIQETLGPNVPQELLKPEIRYIDERSVFGLLHFGPYEEVPQTFERVAEYAINSGLAAYDLKFIGLYKDDPEVTPRERLRADICLLDCPSLVPQGEFRRHSIPGGMYAVALHKGSYERLSETYLQLIGHWLPSSGFELAFEPVLEKYLNSPKEVPQDQLRVEVCVRLQKS